MNQSYPTVLCWNFPLFVPQNSMSILNTFSQNSTSHEKIKVNLTIDELKEAGYDNSKRLWSEEEDKILVKLAQKTTLSWK